MNSEFESAARDGDAQRLRELLGEGADVDARDRHGQTALMLASHRGHLEAVRVLVSGGANLDVTAKYRLSALMLAVIGGHVEVARLLIESGANVAVRGTGAPGFHERTAYDLALERGMTELADELRPPP